MYAHTKFIFDAIFCREAVSGILKIILCHMSQSNTMTPTAQQIQKTVLPKKISPIMQILCEKNMNERAHKVKRKLRQHCVSYIST